MLVKVEAVPQDSSTRTMVRVRSAIGAAVVLWQGASGAPAREQRVEWTVDDDIVWATNAGPAASATPELREEGDRIVFRGRMNLIEDGAAALDMAGTQILFDLAEPLPPNGADGSWVEVHVGRDNVSVWPFQL